MWLGAGVGRVWPPGAQGTAVAVTAGGEPLEPGGSPEVREWRQGETALSRWSSRLQETNNISYYQLLYDKSHHL